MTGHIAPERIAITLTRFKTAAYGVLGADPKAIIENSLEKFRGSSLANSCRNSIIPIKLIEIPEKESSSRDWGQRSVSLVGALNMYFLSPSKSDWASSLPSPVVGMLVCPPMFWPPSNSVESWSAMYRLAYEQIMDALAPSSFQRAIEPSMN
jgi:hypothetical protein